MTIVELFIDKMFRNARLKRNKKSVKIKIDQIRIAIAKCAISRDVTGQVF